jgi:hypothetical protein
MEINKTRKQELKITEFSYYTNISITHIIVIVNYEV